MDKKEREEENQIMEEENQKKRKFLTGKYRNGRKLKINKNQNEKDINSNW